MGEGGAAGEAMFGAGIGRCVGPLSRGVGRFPLVRSRNPKINVITTKLGVQFSGKLDAKFGWVSPGRPGGRTQAPSTHAASPCSPRLESASAPRKSRTGLVVSGDGRHDAAAEHSHPHGRSARWNLLSRFSDGPAHPLHVPNLARPRADTERRLTSPSMIARFACPPRRVPRGFARSLRAPHARPHGPRHPRGIETLSTQRIAAGTPRLTIPTDFVRFILSGTSPTRSERGMPPSRRAQSDERPLPDEPADRTGIGRSGRTRAPVARRRDART